MCSRNPARSDLGNRDCDLTCQKGTYYDRGDYSQDACKACPDGKTTLKSNAYSIDQCVAPLVCVPGSGVSNRTDQVYDTCVKCPADRYSPGGSGGCLQCDEGSFVNLDQTGCTSCQPGFGSVPTDAPRVCSACPPGTASKGGAAECLACAADELINVARSACLKCDIGFGIDNLQAPDRCVQCTSDRYGEGGITRCSICPVSQRPKVDQSGCDDCQPGEYFDRLAPSPSCVSCGPGKYFAGLAYYPSTCRNCPPGSIQAGDSLSCTSCPFESFPNRQRTACINTCDAGEQWDNELAPKGCQRCPVGKVNAGDARRCYLCPLGQYPDPNQVACLSCPAGTYGTEGVGELLYNEDVCQLCPDGQTSLAGSSSLADCRLEPSIYLGRRAALARVGACDRSLTACMITTDTWEW